MLVIAVNQALGFAVDICKDLTYINIYPLAHKPPLESRTEDNALHYTHWEREISSVFYNCSTRPPL